jgi:hypothetical protein
MICFVYAVVAHLSSAEKNKSTVEICEKGGGGGVANDGASCRVRLAKQRPPKITNLSAGGWAGDANI